MPKLILLSSIVFLSIVSVTGAAACSSKGPATLDVSVAASLTDALKEINNLYAQGKPDMTITTNFASSGTLQTQIENGAPADVFISAAAIQMDNLQSRGLMLSGTRRNLLSNKVVLVVPVDSTLGITGFKDLAGDKVERVAIGDPKSVPAGAYGQQVLDDLGVTAGVRPKLIMGSDVRQVLSYVESGNVDAGIVYSTDARTSSKVTVVADAPDGINARVAYPAAVMRASKNPDAAKDYLKFLFSIQARGVFEKYGFSVAGN